MLPTPPAPMGCAERITHLLLDPTWIKRRVESILLSPTGETVRKVSFDFSLPADLLVTADQSEDAIIPLCFMRKEALVDLDVTDAGGATLPVLSTSENGGLAKEAVLWLLRRLPDFEEGLEAGVTAVIFEAQVPGDLAEVREARRSRFAQVARAAVDPQALTGGPPSRDDRPCVEDLAGHLLRRALGASAHEAAIVQATASLLSAMSDSYVFAVRAPHTAGERTVVKMSYACTVSTETGVGSRIRRLVSPASTTLSLTAGLMSAASTHIELAVPAGVAIVGVRPGLSSEHGPWSAPPAATENRVHLVASRSRLQGLSSVPLDVRLAPRRSGIVTAALIASLLNLAGTLLLLFSAGIVARAQMLGPGEGGGPPIASEVAEGLGPLRDTNAYTLATLVVGAALAVVVIAQSHAVERRLYRAPKIVLLLSALAMGALLTLQSYRASNRLPVAAWSSTTGWGFLTVALLLGLWGALVFFKACDDARAATRPSAWQTATPTASGSRPRPTAASETALFAHMDAERIRPLVATVLSGDGDDTR